MSVFLSRDTQDFVERIEGEINTVQNLTKRQKIVLQMVAGLSFEESQEVRKFASHRDGRKGQGVYRTLCSLERRSLIGYARYSNHHFLTRLGFNHLSPEDQKLFFVDWKTETDGIFRFLGARFDVIKAKRILVDRPRLVSNIYLPRIEPLISDCLNGDYERAAIIVDTTQVQSGVGIDETVPLIAADLSPYCPMDRFPRRILEQVPIDGWHRVARALQEGKNTLPVVNLFDEEIAWCFEEANVQAAEEFS